MRLNMLYSYVSKDFKFNIDLSKDVKYQCNVNIEM